MLIVITTQEEREPYKASLDFFFQFRPMPLAISVAKKGIEAKPATSIFIITQSLLQSHIDLSFSPSATLPKNFHAVKNERLFHYFL